MHGFFSSGIFEQTTDLMFVEDRQGSVVFFPWGERHQGFILEDRGLQKKAVRFFRWSMILLFFFMMACTAIVIKEPWSPMVGLVYWGCSAFLAWYLYAHWVTRDLLPSPKSYGEIVLEKLAPEGEDAWEIQAPVKIIVRPKRVTYRTWKGLAGLKQLYATLPDGLVAFALVFLGICISFVLAGIVSSQSSDPFINRPVIALIFFFLSLIGYLCFRQFTAEKRTLWQWIGTGSAYIILMAVGWGVVFYILYLEIVEP